jgi:UPF0755 protein
LLAVRRLILVVLALLALCAGASWWYYTLRPLPLSAERVEVRVPAGASARAIAQQAREAGVGVNETLFVVFARATEATRSLRAGRYAVERGATLATLLDKLRSGDALPSRFTIVEGTTVRELRARLAQEQDLRPESAALSDAQLAKAVGASYAQSEGLLAPETYVFAPGSSDLELLRQAHRAQMQALEQAWAQRAPDLPLASPYEALVLASVVEKETGRAEDRPLVASVFINRLRLGMPLQSDPTVIYGLGEGFDGNLRKRDLQTDTPYNSYTRRGLPPTPIALPGRASIEAVLNPPRSDYLYFVARGDGSSQFSATLAEHNRAVDKFQRGRR